MSFFRARGINTIQQGMGLASEIASLFGFARSKTKATGIPVSTESSLTMSVGLPPGAFYALPADRSTTWQPGVTYNGGITNRTTVFTTVSSLGAGVDNRANIQAAIDACPVGQVVQLAAADFGISGGTGLVMKSGITLRGTGTWPNRSRLIKLGSTAAAGGGGGSAGPAVRIGNAVDFDGVTTGGANTMAVVANLTADGAKGAFTVSVASTAGLAVGDLVRVDELSAAQWMTDQRLDGQTVSFAGIQIWASTDFRVTWQKVNSTNGAYAADMGPAEQPGDPAHWYTAYTCPDRPICEMKRIASLTSTTITFETPLHISYRAAQTARVAKYSGTVVSDAGVESITARGFDLGTFAFQHAHKCWTKDCEADFWFDKPFRFAAAYRCEATGCYQHGTPWPSNSAENYAFIFDFASADCLVEDCISIECDKVAAARAGGAGCVMAYCYLDKGHIFADSWVEVHANASHFTGPHHVLFEGNWAPNADSDFTHGSSVYITHYRNFYTGNRSSFVWSGTTFNDVAQTNGPRRCGATGAYGYWHSYVGNVLGTPNKMTTAAGGTENWSYEGFDIFDPPCVWLLGWEPPIHGSYDPNINNPAWPGAMIRDGNYDYLTNSVRWHGKAGPVGGGTPAPLKNSWYRGDTKPAFFGSLTWPWVDPIGATKTFTLPAKARYDAGTPFTPVS